MPTQPPTPPPIYHTPTGDVAGVWSKSTGWHLPYTSTATAMPSQYAGQTRAYNPQTKTWEEMTWVDTVGYMSPYQMKGILEGTIGYSGDLGKIKKAYADIGGTFTKREEVKVKEPEPSVVMYQTKEGLITGYESPYLQQSIIFKKELSETEAKKEIQKLHLERGIAKTRAEQLAKGYLTAEISPFTPQALRESEIQRQTIEQTWRTKIAVPKLIEIFTKEREAKGIGTTWEGQPISISKEVQYLILFQFLQQQNKKKWPKQKK